MITFLRTETVGSLDQYFLEDRNVLSSKEVTITIDFQEKSLSGSCIAYGSWFDLNYDEIRYYLKVLQEKEVLKNFKILL